MLQRKPSLTDQARAHIKQQILSEVFEGDRIPSENELAQVLGVSRTTIRDALSRLEQEGVVYRKQGAGTFVNKAGLQIKTRLEEMWSYEAVLRAHGYAPSNRILVVETTGAAPEKARELEIEVGDTLLRVEKLFLEDDQPVILTINEIPADILGEPPAAEVWTQPVYEILREYGRQRLSFYLSEIVPVIANEVIAARLGVQAGRPLISFSEIGYNEENQPVLKARSYFHDDLLRLRLIRRKSIG